MKKIVITLAFAIACGAAQAANLDAPPPYAGDSEPQAAGVTPPNRSIAPKGAQEDMSIAPTERDMRKARADRERGNVPRQDNDKRTKIEAVRDPNNHVTEYVVTPGSTKIPYKMENQADRPIDTRPGGNPGSTLGTPKFIEFGW